MTDVFSIRRTLAYFCGLGFAAATSVAAHDTLPTQWCQAPNTTPTIVAQFDFAPAQLVSYRERNPVLKKPPRGVVCVDERSCGIIDDWYWADQLSHETCSGPQGGVQAKTQTLVAMPFVQTPESFNANDHHERYSFQSGHLQGVCVVCVPIEAPAPGPAPAPSPDGSEAF